VGPHEAAPTQALTETPSSFTLRLPFPQERLVMAKSDITGKRKLRAQNVSHSNIKTKRWQNLNIQTRRVWVPELRRFVTLNLTTRDIRTIDKIGVTAYAKRHGVKL
jgi:large subunit ribosomal protein L28